MKNVKDCFNKQEAKQAYKEGWLISFTGLQDAVHNLYELQRVDEPEDGSLPEFEDDDEAVKFVVEMANRNPGGLHAKAVIFLADNSPNEISSVFKDIIPTEVFNMLLKQLNIKL